MKQHEFIWAARDKKPLRTIQDDHGGTTVELRKGIKLVHNYKQKDRMTIELSEDKSVYIIPSEKELKEIYRIHMENESIDYALHRYCSTNLTKIK